MAIGATQASVRNLVLKQTARLALIGAGIGIFLSITSSRFLGSLIYGVHRTDPLTFARGDCPACGTGARGQLHSCSPGDAS